MLNKSIPKKVYAIDPAFAWSNSLSFSQDLGRRLENMVYLKMHYSHPVIFTTGTK